jgi:hypothetical protein
MDFNEYAEQAKGGMIGATKHFEEEPPNLARPGTCCLPGCERVIFRKSQNDRHLCRTHANWRKTHRYQEDWADFKARLLAYIDARREQ